MAYLTVVFEKEISVPEWEYCNDQTSKTNRGDYYCNFLKGDKNERGCRLFDKTLYASYEWVKKCYECLAKSKLDGIKENK